VSKIDFWQIGCFALALLIATPLLGTYMAKVFSGEQHFLRAILRPFENFVYRIAMINTAENMNWKRYSSALVFLSILGFLTTFLLQIFQNFLLFNYQNLPGVAWPVALNTAISFVTNTNWQAYAGENTLSYTTQALGLGVQNFLSPAIGFAVLLALIRGLLHKENNLLGNFWVDITRMIIYVLLPLASIMAILLISQGVIQNFSPYIIATTFENITQIIPMGPVASQEAIKQLGSNGGGFFGANSAHPFENPTSFTNFLSMLAMMLIPAASVYMFGILTKSLKHATAIYTVMILTLGIFIITGTYEEQKFNYTLNLSENLEGKETRFGVTNSVLWAMATTATSNGSVNSMHDSLSPLTGGLALLQILLGEIIFGGVGSGLYGMLLYVLLAVFLCGLMIGRTPEYFGKKIEAFEIKLVLIALLLPSAVVLLGSSLTLLIPSALASLSNGGPHGLTEILYAWGSVANNNGSAFAGLNSNTLFYNLAFSLAMLLGRFGVIIPVLAIAGSLGGKKVLHNEKSSFSIHGLTFVSVLVAVIFLVSALTFMPALVLGPVAEYFLMDMGVSF
jgi:K+-transporting ATPase ATPase A chain